MLAGPVSEYYLTKWVDRGIAVIQDNSVVRSWSIAPGSYAQLAIVVNGDVKTYSHYSSGAGAQYSLDGVATGTLYPNQVGQYPHDGTTDGTYNYAFFYGMNKLYRFGLDWSNPELVFSLSGTSRLGVTYDPTDDTFWLCGWGNSLVEHYTKTGQFLGSFSTDSYTGSLALDHADGTLWLSVGASDTLKQYSKTGTLLSTLTISGLGPVYGGEFNFALVGIPEPSSIFLLFICIVLLLFSYKKNTRF